MPDAILKWSDIVQQPIPAYDRPRDSILFRPYKPFFDREYPGEMFQDTLTTYRQYLQFQTWQRRLEVLPDNPANPVESVFAFVNAGRWVDQCLVCNSAVPVEIGDQTICVICGTGSWKSVVFPADREAIEDELLRQPGYRLGAPFRNWEPDWTLDYLRERTASANAQIAAGVRLIRKASIGTTRVWTTGEVLSATNINTHVSSVADDLAARNGPAELEDSIRVLPGAGNRFIGLPGGTAGQRPTGAAGRMRWNQDDTAIDVHDGSSWLQLLGSGAVTFEALNGNGDIGSANDQVSPGDHVHPGNAIFLLANETDHDILGSEIIVAERPLTVADADRWIVLLALHKGVGSGSVQMSLYEKNSNNTLASVTASGALWHISAQRLLNPQNGNVNYAVRLRLAAGPYDPSTVQYRVWAFPET